MILIILIALLLTSFQKTAASCFIEDPAPLQTTIAGSNTTDINLLSTVTSKHRLASLRYCTNANSLFLLGIQAVTAVVTKRSTSQQVELSRFGSLSSDNYCRAISFKLDEYVTSLTLFRDNVRVFGFKLKTSLGNSYDIGFTVVTIA